MSVKLFNRFFKFLMITVILYSTVTHAGSENIVLITLDAEQSKEFTEIAKQVQSYKESFYNQQNSTILSIHRIPAPSCVIVEKDENIIRYEGATQRLSCFASANSWYSSPEELNAIGERKLIPEEKAEVLYNFIQSFPSSLKIKMKGEVGTFLYKNDDFFVDLRIGHYVVNNFAGVSIGKRKDFFPPDILCAELRYLENKKEPFTQCKVVYQRGDRTADMAKELFGF